MKGAEKQRKFITLGSRFGWFCDYCGVRLTHPDAWPEATPVRELTVGEHTFYDPAPPTLDHRVPQLLGGTDANTNLLLACETCNGLKGHQTEHKFRQGHAAYLAEHGWISPRSLYPDWRGGHQ